MKKILFILMMVFCLTSCDHVFTRHFGGTTRVELERGERLVEATWKGYNIWYLTERMDSDYVPTVKKLKEKSKFGTLNGTVIFYEKR